MSVHVTHILEKLQVTNRGEAGALAETSDRREPGGGILWAGVNDPVCGRMPLMSRVSDGQLPAMNRRHLLSVLVDEPAEDHRASPDMLNRTVAAMTESP